MKKLLFASLLFNCGALHGAEKAAEKSATIELLDAMRFEQVTVDSAVAGFDGFIDQMKQNGVPPKAINEIRAEARKLYVRIFTAPEMKKQIAELYEKHFTHDEILQLTEFYRSPLGQKTITGLPAIMKDAMAVAMPAMQKEMAGFQQKVGEIVEKHKKEEGGKAPTEKE